MLCHSSEPENKGSRLIPQSNALFRQVLAQIVPHTLACSHIRIAQSDRRYPLFPDSTTAHFSGLWLSHKLLYGAIHHQNRMAIFQLLDWMPEALETSEDYNTF